MKKIILILSIISVVFLLSSCNDKYIEVGKKDFSLKAPKELQINTGMIFDGAEIEYQNTEEDYYLVVLKDSKEDYTDYQMSDYQDENIAFILEEGSLKFDVKNKKINNLDAIITNAVTVDEDGKTFWKVALLESDTHFYTIWTWTGPDYVTKNLKKMDKIINTFNLK